MNLDSLSELKSIAIEVGSIFKMTFFPSDGVQPKVPEDTSRTKYFVIIGIDDKKTIIGLLLINSIINKKMFSLIGPYQHCIYSSNYSFLTKTESYIDCYQIKEISLPRIVSDAEYIGFLNEYDTAEIIKLAVSSPVNNKHTLKKFHMISE